MRTRYVWLICAAAVAVVEVLRVLALRYELVSVEALDSLRFTLYLVAGIGGGRLEASGRVRRAVWAGFLAGGVTGLVGCVLAWILEWALGPGTASGMVHPAIPLLVTCGVTLPTGATLGGLGGIAGWGVRRAVEPIE